MLDKIKKAEIEQLTKNILVQSNTHKAPVDLKAVCDQFLIEDKYVELNSISGFAAIRPNEPKQVFINSKEPIVRQRFTAAHELGHIFLHGDQGVLVDTTDTIYHFRSSKQTLGDQTKETEANYFAACLLMPAEIVDEVLSEYQGVSFDDEDTLASLAQRFNVSKIALCTRLGALGYL